MALSLDARVAVGVWNFVLVFLYGGSLLGWGAVYVALVAQGVCSPALPLLPSLLTLRPGFVRLNAPSRRLPLTALCSIRG